MSLRDKVAAQRKQIADSKAAYERSYRFKVGKTVCRLLPGITDPDEFSKPYGAHYIKDPRDPSGKPIAVVGDAEICYGKIDPVRQAISEFISECAERGDEVAAKHAKEWLAKASNVVNLEIISGVDTENNGKVVRWEASSNQYDGVLSVLDDVLTADPSFTMQNGLVFQVERVGTGMNDTKYTFSFFPGTATIAPPSANTLAQRIPLESYVDGKFGMNVTKALNHLSSLLGRDVSAGAITQAVQPAIAAPVQAAQPAPYGEIAETPKPAPVTQAQPEVVDAEFTALAEIDDIPPFDTTPQQPVQAAPVQAAPAPQAAPAASTDAFDSILADLENI